MEKKMETTGMGMVPNISRIMENQMERKWNIKWKQGLVVI